MDIFHWEESMESGFAEIDEQHRHLFVAANGFHEAIVQGKAESTIGEISALLLRDTAQHFRSEEALMHRSSYPAFLDHQAEHHRFESLLADLASPGASPRPFQVIQVFNVLIRGHIVEADLPMIRWIRDHASFLKLGGITPTRLNPAS